MTELEKMQRAKMYIDKMANGIDPITDTDVRQDTVINNVRIARCLFYVSQVLGQVIANGGEVKGASKRVKFYITDKELERVQLSDTPIAISELCNLIYTSVCDEKRRKLQATKITAWLVDKGVLSIVTSAEGKNRKVPSPFAKELGITVAHRSSIRGEYDVNLYNKQAQQFILDNLTAILQESTS